MSNHNFSETQALERATKFLYLDILIGATGSVTSFTGKGIASVVRDGAGAYTVTLDDTYNGFLGGDVTQLLAANQDLTFQFTAETVETTKTIIFVCKTAATSTDPTTASILKLKFELKNSQV